MADAAEIDMATMKYGRVSPIEIVLFLREIF